jgi:mRNA interferase MazF
MKLAQMPGNIILEKGVSGLEKTSVINFSQIATIDRTRLTEQITMLPKNYIEKNNESITFLFDTEK